VLAGAGVRVERRAAAAARADRSVLCSHGAAEVIESRAAASDGDGSQYRGGAITTDRCRLGPSARIIAVCARKSCSASNCALAGEPADAELSTLVISESASSTPIAAPEPVVVALRALSYCPSFEGISSLFSTTVETPPSFARLVSTAASAVPSAGQAIEADTEWDRMPAATESPRRYAVRVF
jgi:hypothetical protein